MTPAPDPADGKSAPVLSCPGCGGSGQIIGPEGPWMCSTCNGGGVIAATWCENCDGSGGWWVETEDEMRDEFDPCPECNGSGRLSRADGGEEP